MSIPYSTREAVKLALGSDVTARDDAQIDRALYAASESVSALCHRIFYPQIATRYWDWPNDQGTAAFRLWLGKHSLIFLITLTAGGTVIVAPDYNLEPANDGPPYELIEINRGSSAAFAAGSSTSQRAISALGLFGYTDDSDSAGALAEALDASETGVDVTDSSGIGVGSLIRVDDERMLVRARSMLDTGQNLGANLTAVQSGTTVAVGSGAAFAVGEIILIDSERMRIVDIAGNNLTVIRGYDGSALAAHTAPADIYAPRTLTVTRAAAGTTAATHSTAAAITRWVPPALVEELTIAEACVEQLQAGAGWARTSGAGDNQRESAGKGLQALRQRCRARHGRQGRMWAV